MTIKTNSEICLIVSALLGMVPERVALSAQLAEVWLFTLVKYHRADGPVQSRLNSLPCSKWRYNLILGYLVAAISQLILRQDADVGLFLQYVGQHLRRDRIAHEEFALFTICSFRTTAKYAHRCSAQPDGCSPATTSCSTGHRMAQ